MYISIKNNIVKSISTKIYEISDSKLIHSFDFNKLSKREINNLINFKNDKELTDIFVDSSFLIEDKFSRKVTFFRDWPGNNQTFYFYDKPNNIFFLSDSIDEIAQNVNNVKLSDKGVRLFLNERKHFHSFTIYENIFMLHPGLKIILDLNNFEISIEPWYTPFKNISIRNFKLGKVNYLNAIDDSLIKNIGKNKNIAIMFSGGSDSCFILWRLINLGFKNFDLFTICVKGEKITNNFAVDNARLFGYETNLIQIDKNGLFKKWKDVLSISYNYLSDMRINGMFAPSFDVIQYLKKYYKNEKCTIVWGSQYSLISPVITTKAIFFKIFPVYFFSFFIKFGIFKSFFENLSIRAIRSHMLSKKIMHKESRTAFIKLYKSSFKKTRNFDQLINLFLSTDYNHLKHWWMDWRNKMCLKYYSNATNVYPFHDRKFQETTMQFSFLLRIGGLINLFRMPSSYKIFFYALFPNNLEIHKLKKGNVKALSEWQSLYRHNNFYEELKKEINYNDTNNISSKIFKQNNIVFPDSYEKFKKLSSKDLEKISGVFYILLRIKNDKITI